MVWIPRYRSWILKDCRFSGVIWSWERRLAYLNSANNCCCLLRVCVCVSCSVMSDSLWPSDCSLPSSSVHGILQARILEWVAIPFSRGSSQPRDQSWVSRIVGRFFTIWATREAVTEHIPYINTRHCAGHSDYTILVNRSKNTAWLELQVTTFHFNRRSTCQEAVLVLPCIFLVKPMENQVLLPD